ncbi:MAG: DUF72 domain-containing protein [Bacteroidia bacterium]|nr:DUF72 domain-containing protein [Bacteroidia bacterium]
MKFGKLPDITPVNFELPSGPGEVTRVLGGKPKGNFRAYVGCPMWGNKSWTGKLYPKTAKGADYLRYYSQSFNTIELNSTHYRVPSPDIARRWAEMAAPGFAFCPKVPQTISHYRKLINCEDELNIFADTMAIFEEKLGCAFVQLHESFSPALLPYLRSFLQGFPPFLPLAIEFRHADWFAEHRLIPEAEELLQNHRVSAVITDVAGRRDVLHHSLTNSTAMIRFVGNGLIPSDYTRANAWIARIAEWVNLGLEKLYFFVHEPDDTFAPEMGAYIIQKLNTEFNLNLRIPGIPEEPGRQMRLF